MQHQLSDVPNKICFAASETFEIENIECNSISPFYDYLCNREDERVSNDDKLTFFVCRIVVVSA